jgi:uncharacterized protein YegP (UPF0339 family)
MWGNLMYYTVFLNDSNKLWYWSLDDADGRAIALGGSGYRNKSDAFAAIQTVRQYAEGAPLRDGPTGIAADSATSTIPSALLVF